MLSLSLTLLPALIYLCDVKIYGLKFILQLNVFLNDAKHLPLNSKVNMQTEIQDISIKYILISI